MLQEPEELAAAAPPPEPWTLEKLWPLTIRAMRSLDDPEPATRTMAAKAIDETQGILTLARLRHEDPAVKTEADRLLRELSYEGLRRSGGLDQRTAKRRDLHRAMSTGQEGRFEIEPGTPAWEAGRAELRRMELEEERLTSGLTYLWREPILGAGELVDKVELDRPYVGWIQSLKERASAGGAYRLDPVLARTPLVIDSPEAIWRGQILEGDIVEHQGKRFIQTQDFGRWELPNYTRFKDELRQGFFGNAPGTYGLANSESVLVGLSIWANDLLSPPQMDLRGQSFQVPSADPSFVMPWLPAGMGPEDLKNPVNFRAVVDLLEEMRENGELHPRWYEVLSSQLVGVTEFIAVNKALSAAVGAAGRLAASTRYTPARAAGVFAQRIAGAYGITADRPYLRGLEFGARNVAEEAVYGAVQSIFQDESLVTGAWEGTGEGLAELGIASVMGKPVRTAIYKLAQRFNLPGDQLMKRYVDARHGGLSYSNVWDRFASLPSKNVEFRRLAGQVFKDAWRAEQFVRMWDATWVGLLFGGWQHAAAAAGPQWQNLNVAEKAMLSFENLGSPESLGGAGAFWVTALGYNAVGSMRGLGPRSFLDQLSELERQDLERIQRRLVYNLTHASPENHEEFVQYFEEFREANPDVVAGVNGVVQTLGTEEERLEHFASGQLFAPGEEGTLAPPLSPGSQTLPTARPPRPAVPADRETEVQSFFGPARRQGKRLVAAAEEGTAEEGWWLHSAGRYGIRRAENGAYVIVNSKTGQRVKAPGVKVWSTLVDAMRQVNAIAGVEYQTKLPPEPTPTFETGASPEKERTDPEVIARLSGEFILPLGAEQQGPLAPAQEIESLLGPLTFGPVEPPHDLPERALLEAIGTTPEEIARAAAGLSAEEAARILAEAELPEALVPVRDPVTMELSELGDDERRALVDAGRLDPVLATRSEGEILETMVERRRAARDPDLVRQLSRLRFDQSLARKPHDQLFDLARSLGFDPGARDPKQYTRAFLAEQVRARGLPVLKQAGLAPAARRAHRTPTERAREGEMGLARFLQAHGGLAFDPDLVETAESVQDPGFGRLMQAAGSGRGLPIDQAIELALSYGFFPGQELGTLDPQAFRDALASDFVPALVEREERLAEARAELEAEEYLLAEESLKIAARAAHDAGIFLAGAGRIGRNDSRLSVEFQTDLARLARGDTALLDEIAQKNPAVDQAKLRDVWQRAVQAARDAQLYSRYAARELAGRQSDEQRLDVELYFNALDELADTGALSPELSEDLKGHGMLDETGKLHPGVPRRLAEWFQAAVSESVQGMGESEIIYLYALSPAEVILGPLRLLRDQVFVDPYEYELTNGQWHPVETGLSRAFSASRALNRAERFLERWPALSTSLHKLRRFVHDNVGRNWSGSYLSPEQRALMYQAHQEVFSPRQAEYSEAIALGTDILNGLRWNLGLAPSDLREAFLKMIESGAFKRMKGPEDVEALYGPDSGFLFPLMQRMVELTNSLGADLVQLGFISLEQFNAHKGQYVMSSKIRVDDETAEERLARGDYSVIFPARDLAQGGRADDELAIVNWEPFSIIPRAVGQEGAIRRFLGALHDLADKGLAVPQASLSGRTPWERLDWEVAALDSQPGDKDLLRTRDPISGDRIRGRQVRMRRILTALESQSQTREEWEAGTSPGPGRHPFTAGKERLFDTWLGPKDENGKRSGGAAIPRGIASELDWMLTDLTEGYSGERKGFARMARAVDGLTRWWRKNMTIMRPAHWLLSVANDLQTNHLLGRVGLGDFARFVFTNSGAYKQAMDHLLDWQESNQYVKWTSLEHRRTLDRARAARDGSDRRTLFESIPMPTELASAGWTQTRWANVLQANELTRLLSGGSFVNAVLDSGVVANVMGSMGRRDEVTAALLEDVRRREGLDGDQAELFVQAVTELGRRMAPGQSEIDRQLVTALSSDRADERVKALESWIALYQTKEMWVAYAAALNLLSRNPGMTLADAAAAGKAGTADYRNANSNLRRLSTTFNVFNSQLYQRTERHPVLPRVAWWMIGRPFLSYDSVMLRPKLKAMFTHPWRAAGIAALGHLMVELVWRVGAQGPEEEDELWEALAGTLGQEGVPMPAHLREDAERLLKYVPTAYLPNGLGGGLESDAAGEANYQMLVRWLRMQPYVIPAPSRGGQTRISDVSELAPGAGDVMRIGQRVRAAFSPDVSLAKHGEWLLRNLYGFWPSFGIAIASSASKAIFPSGGKSGIDAGVTEVKRILERTMPAIHPVLAPLSRPGIHTVENLFLGGQDIASHLRGIDPVWKDAPEDLIADTVANWTWKSQGILPYAELDSDDGVARQVLSEVLPAGIQRASSEWTIAAKRVSEQVSEIVTSSYARWKQMGMSDWEGEERPASFDQLVGRDLALASDLDQQALAHGLYKLAAEPRSALGRMIARQDPALQEPMLVFGIGFLSGTAFNARGRVVMLEAARHRSMAPELFEALYRSAMRDPAGRGILKEMHRRLVDLGQRENLEQHFKLFSQMEPPDRESQYEAHQDWLELRRLFEGMAGDFSQWPFTPPEPPSSFLGPQGRLGGFPAVLQELQTR